MNSNKLEELRNELNLTKLDIAKILNVSPSIYCRWENGKDFIPTKRLYELAEFFSINIDYLVGITNKRINIKVNKPIEKSKVSINTRILREELNLTLREIGTKLNTTSSTWSAYETGKTLILSSFLIEICKTSNFSIDWLLERSTKKYR